MNTRTRFTQLLFAGCIAGIALQPAAAAISDQEFNALKDLVTKQGQRIDQLEKAHNQDQLNLDQDRKVHEQDQQEIQQLKQRLEETQKTASDAQQKATAVSQVQPIHAIPEASSATHNFMVVGDAEIQFGKTEGSHSAFELADFAPIFLFRAREYDHAQQQYEAAMKAFPKDKALYQKRMVELYAATGQNQAANGLLAEILKANSKDVDAIAMRAALMLTTGNREQIAIAANDHRRTSGGCAKFTIGTVGLDLRALPETRQDNRMAGG